MPPREFRSKRVTLHQGDCITIMKKMAAESVDTIITDPPYGLNFMGADSNDPVRSTDGTGMVPYHGLRGFTWPRYHAGVQKRGQILQQWHTRWASEALRVAKPGAFLLAFGGTRTFHRLAAALEDSGWQIRDCLMWLYGSGFPKSHDFSKDLDRQAGLKRRPVGISSGPNHKHYIGERYTRSRRTRFGVIQDQPIATQPVSIHAKTWNGWGTTLKPAWEPIIVAMKPTQGSFAANAVRHGVAGLHINAGRIHSPESTALGIGRWPANVLLTHHHQCTRQGTKSVTTNGHYPSRRGRGGVTTSGHRGQSNLPERKTRSEKMERWDCHPGCPVASLGAPSRFFYSAKASKHERYLGVGNGKQNSHPTVKPMALMEYLCRLTESPTGGVILDPFAGSGTTLCAAINTGRTAIGIERNKEFFRIAKRRVQYFEKIQNGGLSKS